MENAERIADASESATNARLIDALKETSLNLDSLEANVRLVKRRLAEHLADLED